MPHPLRSSYHSFAPPFLPVAELPEGTDATRAPARYECQIRHAAARKYSAWTIPVHWDRLVGAHSQRRE